MMDFVRDSIYVFSLGMIVAFLFVSTFSILELVREAKKSRKQFSDLQQLLADLTEQQNDFYQRLAINRQKEKS